MLTVSQLTVNLLTNTLNKQFKCYTKNPKLQNEMNEITAERLTKAIITTLSHVCVCVCVRVRW